MIIRLLLSFHNHLSVLENIINLKFLLFQTDNFFLKKPTTFSFFKKKKKPTTSLPYIYIKHDGIYRKFNKI